MREKVFNDVDNRSEKDESTISVCSFWLEGVSILAVGIPGTVSLSVLSLH
jgi:hypothetical protein